ncbi:hypothetical protein NQ317_012784 [Molorchus minor]|uniref:Secreted protein n=1 Tax=Molorchus minor TaxID=1323400 RepID=A0ABQ9K696_9CUCU|nr:hypothetical protein NQ317_012784 [Molorchus minor]
MTSLQNVLLFVLHWVLLIDLATSDACDANLALDYLRLTQDDRRVRLEWGLEEQNSTQRLRNQRQFRALFYCV